VKSCAGDRRAARCFSSSPRRFVSNGDNVAFASRVTCATKCTTIEKEARKRSIIIRPRTDYRRVYGELVVQDYVQDRSP